jgi:hypothetical protein
VLAWSAREAPGMGRPAGLLDNPHR